MVTAQRDYYEVLGVTRDADQKTIKDAFRTLAMKYHPDRSDAPDAEEKFKEIAEAYAVLSDPGKRAQYDTGGFAGVADFTPEDLFSGIDFGEIFADMGFGFDFDGGSIFDRFLRQRRRGPLRGQDIHVHLVVPLERINRGGDEALQFTRQVTCLTCSGSGVKPGTQPRNCELCGGSGRKVVTRDEKKDSSSIRFQQISVCPRCHGRGTFIDHPCEECAGIGKIDKTDSIKITIPAGLEEGSALRVKAHGLPSDETGGEPGDLFATVTSAPDPRFERVGADLWRNEILEVADAVLGTKLKVPTMKGTVNVKIPPGIQPDEVLRLRGKGLPKFDGKSHGDLNIRIQVHIPEEPTDEERKLFEQLRKLGQHGNEGKRWFKYQRS